jgi:hypothetical protein
VSTFTGVVKAAFRDTGNFVREIHEQSGHKLLVQTVRDVWLSRTRFWIATLNYNSKCFCCRSFKINVLNRFNMSPQIFVSVAVAQIICYSSNWVPQKCLNNFPAKCNWLNNGKLCYIVQRGGCLNVVTKRSKALENVSYKLQTDQLLQTYTDWEEGDVLPQLAYMVTALAIQLNVSTYIL